MTEAIPCYYGGSTRLSTHYAAGNIIHLTYRENAKFSSTTIPKGWWADANYDSNYYDRVRIGGSVKVKEAISTSHLVVGDAAGYFNLAVGKTFDVSPAGAVVHGQCQCRDNDLESVSVVSVLLFADNAAAVHRNRQ